MAVRIICLRTFELQPNGFFAEGLLFVSSLTTRGDGIHTALRMQGEPTSPRPRYLSSQLLLSHGLQVQGCPLHALLLFTLIPLV